MKYLTELSRINKRRLFFTVQIVFLFTGSLSKNLEILGVRHYDGTYVLYFRVAYFAINFIFSNSFQKFPWSP